jgi:hypothetical protein
MRGSGIVVALALLLPAALSRAQEGTGEPEVKPAGETDFGVLLDGVLAVVGNQVVTRSELGREMRAQVLLLEAQRRGGVPVAEVEAEFRKLQATVADNLVDNKLLLLAAIEGKVDVDEKVQKHMKKLREGFASSPEKLVEFLALRGHSSVEEYERNLKEEALRETVVFRQVGPKADLREDELEAEFDRRHRGKRASSLGCSGAVVSYFTLEQLLIPLPEDTTMEELVEAYAVAFACHRKLLSGEATMETAIELCGNEMFKPVFGSIGELNETQSFDKQFQVVFDELTGRPDASLSQPFLVGDGLRVLRKVSSREGCVEDPAEIARLKEQLSAKASDEKFARILKAWLARLRAKYRVDLRPVDVE